MKKALKTTIFIIVRKRFNFKYELPQHLIHNVFLKNLNNQ